jgi:hypothetical protein
VGRLVSLAKKSVADPYSVARAAGTGTLFLALRHSSKPCSDEKVEGTNSTARQVEAIMPLNTLASVKCGQRLRASG